MSLPAETYKQHPVPISCFKLFYSSSAEHPTNSFMRIQTELSATGVPLLSSICKVLRDINSIKANTVLNSRPA
jgi:hypothetical protein